MNMKRYQSGSNPILRPLAGLSVAIVLTGLLAVPAFASFPLQDQAASGPLPRVGLTELTGTPGASLMMPLYFTPAPDRPLRSFVVEIEFVSNNLKFQKASPGLAAEQANAEITTSLTQGEPDSNNLRRSKLRVNVSLKDADVKAGLPDGLLAYLLFEISLDARPFAIKLTPTVIAAEDTSSPPQPVTQVATEQGLVIVQAVDVMPEATCFFFSH